MVQAREGQSSAPKRKLESSIDWEVVDRSLVRMRVPAAMRVAAYIPGKCVYPTAEEKRGFNFKIISQNFRLGRITWQFRLKVGV
jgi:hypothetical protein